LRNVCLLVSFCLSACLVSTCFSLDWPACPSLSIINCMLVCLSTCRRSCLKRSFCHLSVFQPVCCMSLVETARYLPFIIHCVFHVRHLPATLLSLNLSTFLYLNETAPLTVCLSVSQSFYLSPSLSLALSVYQ
jgi:hypothetical protein